MIPLTVDVPMKRLPWANWGLILATLVISLAVPYVPGEGFAFLAEAPTQPQYSPLVLQRHHFAAYQLVTSLFQHAGWAHLLGNMLFLFVFGNAINAKLGHLGFLAAYLGIGVLEGIVWLAVCREPATLGASAAIMGLCGMFFVLYPLNAVRVFWDEEWEITFITGSWTGELPGWLLVLVYLAFDIWGAVFDRAAGIGYISHIVGGLLGCGLAVVLLKTGALEPDRGEQTLLQWLGGEGPTGSEERRPGQWKEFR